MGFLKNFWKWFKGFFGQVAQTTVGIAVEEMKDVALDIVSHLEKNSELSGNEKWQKAREVMDNKFSSAESAAINLAIESALALVKDRLK